METSPLEVQCETAIDGLYKTIYDQQAEYDKQLLTLSSGLLGVSLVFIKDVVPLDHASYIALLYGSWVSFFLCVLLVLLSFQVSIYGQSRTIDFWESLKVGTNLGTRHIRTIKKGLEILNWTCGALFFVGVLCLTGFVILNVAENRKENSMKTNDGNSVKDGAPWRVPSEERGGPIRVPNVVPSQAPVTPPATPPPPKK